MLPVKPSSQKQVKLLTPSAQVPPFIQGAEAQSTLCEKTEFQRQNEWDKNDEKNYLFGTFIYFADNRKIK